MRRLGWYIAKVTSKITGNKEVMNNYYRKFGAEIGQGVLICTDISGPEAFLISIGNGTTISVDVAFITHDYSIRNLSSDLVNLFGKIVIGKNCFIGERSILMYGVELADNIIVASGSVVTKSFSEERIVIGGNPARKIGTWDDFYKKASEKSISRAELRKVLTDYPEKLVVRKGSRE